MATNIVQEADRIPDAVLFSKMASVMGAMSRLRKTGKNEHFGYKFATSEDVADMVRTELAAQNIAFFTSMKEVKQDTVIRKNKNGERAVIRTSIIFEFTFACGDTGALRTSTWHAESEDDSDKGINKAASAGEKYFLMKTFVLSSGDEKDADKEGSRGQLQSKKQAPIEIRWQDDEEQMLGLKTSINKHIFKSENADGVLERALALIDKPDFSSFATRKEAWDAVDAAYNANLPPATPVNGTAQPPVDELEAPAATPAPVEDKPTEAPALGIAKIYTPVECLAVGDIITTAKVGKGKKSEHWEVIEIGGFNTANGTPIRQAVLLNCDKGEHQDRDFVEGHVLEQVIGGPKIEAANKDASLVKKNASGNWVWVRDEKVQA